MGAARHTQRAQEHTHRRSARSEPPAKDPVTAFTLFVPGPAHGQGRARSGNGRVYTPQPTREHAAKIQMVWLSEGRPTLPDGPYTMTLVSGRRRPASHLNRNGELNAAGKRTPVPGKPDLDNEVKQYLDALCAVNAVPDDRWLTRLRATKKYVWGATEGVTVTFAVDPDDWGAE